MDRLLGMVVISSWSPEDRTHGTLEVARELAAVWVVHLQRSYRMIREARRV
ncbi:hypothetical protein GCM10018962_53220 [Dactylosporangium matsuzakiense]|uniref:Uncharacterized protein n=1 Tax=Dactylosporangium matsuzakiense TaxID=53360 RepID=A0A9W6KZG3_9ACTN|nr:hypothetical protein GCM10017581_100500 [Dactylosporangium matsuzakiense]